MTRATLVTTSEEGAGANCANGGTKIEAGPDEDGNGVLDPSEVTSTSYVCDGDGGNNSLVTTSEEPAGTNCPFGGPKIETGLDVNDDGTLDPSEVNAAATSYVCNIAPNGALSPSTGIVIAYKPNAASTSPTAPISVRFTLKDDRGYPLDVNGAYSINTPIAPRFSISWFTKDAQGNVGPLVTYTKKGTSPTMFDPKSANSGTLVENGFGAGDYTYTFPTTSVTNGNQAVAYDATKLDKTHVIWTQATRQTDLIFQGNANTFEADNKPYYFVPDGSSAPLKREIAAQSGCNNCHAKFKPETTTTAEFHGGGRVDVGLCNVCHSPDRTSNPSANSATFVHRIHHGDKVATANQFHGIAATYPQDIRLCATCHGNAEQGGQMTSNPSIEACGGCHDYVSFSAAAPIVCGVFDSLQRGPDGKPLPCNHGGGPRTNAECATCHGTGQLFSAALYHKPVTPPDPSNSWKPGGTNSYTNAAFVTAGGFLPAGADRITYDVKSVDAVLDTSVTPNVKRPQITFKFKRNGTDVVFQTFAAGSVTELMPNFVGSPSAYFAFAVPQDANPTPSDFNASVSGYIKKIWDGSATGSGAGTLVGPDSMGYYKLTLTGVQIPSTAKMLTGGIGYTYALSGTPPLVQTNVPPYTWIPNVPADGKAQGGLSVPAPNVWKVATGYTGRRAIVDNAKCNACHSTLGVAPGFHVGERNDGPTCSFCHTPNRASAGWSAGSKYFIHAVHAGRKRTVNYTWHAAAAGPGYDEIEFPGTLNTCTTCHVDNTYDFTNADNLKALANEQLTTVASGTLDPNPLTNSTYYTVSPYVTAGNYGSPFSYNATNDTTVEAAGTTLVMTPITGACAACHDSSVAIDHMRANGGQFYAARSSVLSSPAKEQCMICHGPGRVAAIGLVHQR
ncbi:MAG: OmcA/MtrC family decaheme c-type cytochrome [Kofleriaceae bacterium]